MVAQAATGGSGTGGRAAPGPRVVRAARGRLRRDGTGGAGTGGSGTGGSGTGGSGMAPAGCPYRSAAALATTRPSPTPWPRTCDSRRSTSRALPDAGGRDRGSGYSYGITELKFIPGAPDEFVVLRKLGAVYHYKLDGEAANSATLVRTFTCADDPAAQQRQRHRSAVGGVRSGLHHEQVRLLRIRRCRRRPHSAITRFNYENGAITNPQRIIEFSTDTGGALYHSIGSIGFDKDGNLWGLHGDWNIGNTPAQDLNSPLGKLIRVVPSRSATAGGYEPAPGNPYMAMPKPQSAIYAVGFRSPWRGAVDSRGRYIVGDIGPNAGEEVNVVTRGGRTWDGMAPRPAAPAASSATAAAFPCCKVRATASTAARSGLDPSTVTAGTTATTGPSPACTSTVTSSPGGCRASCSSTPAARAVQAAGHAADPVLVGPGQGRLPVHHQVRRLLA